MASKKTLSDAAQAVTNRFFTQAVTEASETAQEGRQDVGTGKVSSERETPEKAVQTPQMRRVTNKGKKAEDTKVFSFRSWADEVDGWRSYAYVKGVQIDELGAAAMREYIKRHPMTEAEKAALEALAAVRKAQK